MTTFLGMPTAPRGVGHLRGKDPFPVAARRALADTQLRRNLAKATSGIRAKRASVVAEVPDWEQLREAGRAIKVRTMAHLDRYLEQLEAQVTAHGGAVHWARTPPRRMTSWWAWSVRQARPTWSRSSRSPRTRSR